MTRELPPRATRGQKRESPPPRTKAEPPPKRQAIPGRRSVGRPPKVVQDEPPAEEVKEEIVITLPIKIADGKPLPALRAPQAKNLSDAEYQSILESAVLAASVARSRQRWLQDRIFEKFWSKSTYKRKKDMTEEEWAKHKSSPKTPASEKPKPSMTKVGNAKLTVEPHSFDVTLYIVKDPAPQPVYVQNVPGQQFMQYGPAYSQPSSPSSHQNSQRSSPQQSPASTPAPPPLQPQPPARVPAPPPTTASPQPVLNPSSIPRPPAATPAKQPSTPQPPTRPQSSQPASTSATPASKPDPVIAILAERAQKDRALKDVMQIVARGAASPEQLQFFQKHINEITRIVEERKARKEAAEKSPSRSAAAAAAACCSKYIANSPTGNTSPRKTGVCTARAGFAT